MELTDKLKGIPTFYYFNSDHSETTNDHMSRNLKNLEVNYKRVSTSKYTKENVKKWVGLLSDAREYKLPIATAALSITILETLKKWYEDTDEEQVIVSRDNIDFGIIQYWPFDWSDLMEKIPYDWDCFLVGFESTSQIPCYLHPIIPGHNFSVAVLNRRYVRKLLRLHCVDGKYKLVSRIADQNFGFRSGTPDYFIGHCGKTYCMPLFPTHTDFVKKGTKKYVLSKACRLAYYQWWRSDSDLEIEGQHNKHSFEELFTYGKPNDYGMIKTIPTKVLFEMVEIKK